ncbi:MAG TPA: MOSC N-terminal beta barrel domain-containing protein [Acidimicrobiales bacterium]|nr:MOSC N-terminal beta barrel domain-containing protein [Acidimicrobiales bacterium]
MRIGTVEELWRYPVKSMQGARLPSLELVSTGVHDDRGFALIDRDTGALMSAKRYSALLLASAERDDAGAVTITLPDGGQVRSDDPEVDARLSAWLGREVHLDTPRAREQVSYEMTFDPPNDDAEMVAIPTPPGTFLDLAGIHLLTSSTLEGCARVHPELDWDVRRFRPNIVLDADVQPFGEDAWCDGCHLRIGDAVLTPRHPTVRCAMPLRGQPGLERQAKMYAALEDLHANHLGIYVDVTQPGTIAEGDEVQLVDA